MGITDWDNKKERLREYAAHHTGHRSIAEMIRFYWPDVSENLVQSFRTRMATWGVSKPQGPYPLQFLEKMRSSIGFTDSIDSFCDLPLMDWLDRTSTKFRNPVPVARGGTLASPSIRFYPPSCKGVPEQDWDEDGVIDQRYMFVDRGAAAQWNAVHSAQEYGMYNDCKETLEHSLKQILNDNRIIEEIVILGAGSADKDWEVIVSIVQKQKSPLRVIVCDASFHMLVETFAPLSEWVKNNKKFSPLVSIELCCFDFTDRRGWAICHLRPGAHRLITVLGGTIGNVDESKFLRTLSSEAEDGDAILIGGSFYESEDEIRELCGKDIAAQYDEDAKLITLNTVQKVLEANDHTLDRRTKLRNVEIVAVEAERLPDAINSDVPGTIAAVFLYRDSDKGIWLCEGSIQHKEIYLFSSRRYIKQEFITHLSSQYDLHEISTVDHPEHPARRFSHLLFERRSG